MKKIVVIISCLLLLSLPQLHAQTISNTDSLRRVQIQKRKDSIANVIKNRQTKRQQIQDSIRTAKKLERERIRKHQKDFINRKKDRERIRDSIAKESKKAAAARKAYLKNKTKEAKSKAKKKEPSPKKASTKKEQKTPKVKKEKKKTPPKKTKKEKSKKKENNTKSKKTKEKKKRLAKKQKTSNTDKSIKKKKTEPTEKKKSNTKDDKKKKKKPRKKKKRKEFQNVFKKEKKPKKIKQKKKQIKKETKKEINKPAKKQAADSLNKTEKKQVRKKKKARITTPVEKGTRAKTQPSSFSIKQRPINKVTEFSFQFGPSGYIGDLGGNSGLEKNVLGDLNFKERTFFYGFSLAHLRKEAIGLRVSYVFGKIAGSDKNTYFKSKADPSYSRFVRNLDFQSTISEGSLMLEVHPLKLFSYKTKLHNLYLQPYALLGVGRYSFNPQGSYFDEILDNDVWVDLQPLSTEGQGFTEFSDRKPYELTQWNIMYGAGFNYEISPSIKIGMEVIGRKLNTDYLDDVSNNFIDPSLYDDYLSEENAELARILNNKSKLVDAERAYKPGAQRGNSTNNDLYFSITGRLIIKLNRNKKEKVRKTSFFKYDDNEICE